MRKYAVGVALHTGEIVVRIVCADNEVDAMVKAVQEEEVSVIKEELGELAARAKIAELDEEGCTLEFSSPSEVIEHYFEGDIHVSKPVEID